MLLKAYNIFMLLIGLSLFAYSGTVAFAESSGGISLPHFSAPGEGRTISTNLVWAPEAGFGLIVRATNDHKSVHGGFWFGKKTNGVLGVGITSDYDEGDWEVNGEIGYSVVFKKREDFAHNLVPYFRLGAAYLNGESRLGMGVSGYGFALNGGLRGQGVVDIEFGKEGLKEDPVVITDDGMTQIDPPCLQDEGREHEYDECHSYD